MPTSITVISVSRSSCWAFATRFLMKNWEGENPVAFLNNLLK